MSISGINREQRSVAGTGFLYLFISIFFILFGAVYEYFSHDVYSWFMLYAFVFPLVGGALPFLGMAFYRIPIPGRISSNLYHSGIATLTSGSVFEGVLEIYGTSNRLVLVYWVLGTFFLLLGLIFYGAGNRKK